ncbi:Probable calcium-binding protein CML22 [Linum grandiflorum]
MATKGSPGMSQSRNQCPSLKYLTSKIGRMLCHLSSANKYKRLDAKLEKKIIEIKRASSSNTTTTTTSPGPKTFKSINTIIMRFPQFKEQLKDINGVFEQFDEDRNGTIDLKELKKCIKKLELNLKDSDVDDLFHSCDFDGSGGIQFNEFIVLLCLIYLLTESSSSPQNSSRMGSPELEATFDTVVEAFLFLDKNGDGMLNKKDLVNALNDASPWEKSPLRITKSIFKEMDRDRNGKVSFREFLFALIQWVGIDADQDIPVTGT